MKNKIIIKKDALNRVFSTSHIIKGEDYKCILNLHCKGGESSNGHYQIVFSTEPLFSNVDEDQNQAEIKSREVEAAVGDIFSKYLQYRFDISVNTLAVYNEYGDLIEDKIILSIPNGHKDILCDKSIHLNLAFDGNRYVIDSDADFISNILNLIGVEHDFQIIECTI